MDPGRWPGTTARPGRLGKGQGGGHPPPAVRRRCERPGRCAYFDRTYHDDICIHEAPSLRYGGDYYGLEGAVRHAVAYTQSWDRWQTSEQRQLHPRIIATDNEAVVLWTLRVQRPGDPGESNFPAISHYRFRDGRVIESRMFFYDTVAVLDFLIRGEAARLA